MERRTLHTCNQACPGRCNGFEASHRPRVYFLKGGVLFDHQICGLTSCPFSDLDTLQSYLAHLICDHLFHRLQLIFHRGAAVARRGTGLLCRVQVSFQFSDARGSSWTFGTRTGTLGRKSDDRGRKTQGEKDALISERLQTQGSCFCLEAQL